jgi:hypothetical protein
MSNLTLYRIKGNLKLTETAVKDWPITFNYICYLSSFAYFLESKLKVL